MPFASAITPNAIELVPIDRDCVKIAAAFTPWAIALNPNARALSPDASDREPMAVPKLLSASALYLTAAAKR
jgi:hypothetical protein